MHRYSFHLDMAMSEYIINNILQYFIKNKLYLFLLSNIIIIYIILFYVFICIPNEENIKNNLL